MQVQRNDKSATEVELNISAAGDELAPIKRHVLKHFATQVKIPGFRPGTAPLDLVEKKTDQKVFLDEFMERALGSLYERAVEHEKIRPVAQPKVALKKFVPFTELEFTVDLEVVGPVKLPDYTKIKLPKKPVAVTDKDIDDVIQSLRKRLAERKEVKRAASDGDEVVIDFAGKDSQGQPVNGAEGRDHPLILGSDNFIPGFEKNVIGSKAGQQKTFTIPFPKDYGVKALQGKKVTFKVDVKKVSELSEPKADDAFAMAAGPFKILAELKADIKKQLTSERQWQADRNYENELIKTISDQSSADIPESLIENQITRMEDEERRNLTYRGQTWQEHLAIEGLSEEEHRLRQRPDAAERVKASLVLGEVAEREQVQVTPEELEVRIQVLKEKYTDTAMQAELDKPENRRDINNQLMIEKTIAKLVGYAVMAVNGVPKLERWNKK